MRRLIVHMMFALAALLALVACGPGAAPAGGGDQSPTAGNPVDKVELTKPVELLFWHRQTGDSETLQQKLIDEFVAANPNIKVKAETLGDYDKLYQKILSSIQAGSPPDLVAAYESQAADYYDAGALVAFDDYIQSKRYGLSEADFKDYITSFIDATKFPQYGGKMLTFPYTKSDLVMYTNTEALKAIGFDKSAATWDEFLSHCRKAVGMGKQCYAMGLDASTFDAQVYSFGGDLVSADGKKVLFDQAPTLKTLQLYETFAKEKLSYQIQGTDDANDVIAGKAIYMIRSSTNVPRMASALKDNAKWDVNIIPQGTTTKKATVLFGANVSIMKTTPEKQLAAWQFIKYLTSRDVTARWGLDPSNGYFPVRQSALDLPASKKFLDDNPRFKQAFEISKNAIVEPSVKGWQEIRTVIVDGITSVFTGKATAEQAQRTMAERAAKILSSQ